MRPLRLVSIFALAASPSLLLLACSQSTAHPPPIEDCTMAIGCNPPHAQVSLPPVAVSSDAGGSETSIGTQDADLGDGNFALDAGTD